MKKIKNYILTSLLVIMIIGISQTNTQAQGISIGIKLGGNLNMQSFSKIDNLTFDTKSVFGYNAGAYVKLKLATFVIQPELLYSTEGSNISISSARGVLSSGDTTFGYLRLPLLVGIQITKLSILAGPNFGILLNSNTTIPDADVKSLVDDKSAIDIGLTVGLDLQIIKKLGIGVRYNIGFTNIQKSVNNFASPEVKNSSFQFMMSYALFNLGV